jgi:hypothetical protein
MADLTIQPQVPTYTPQVGGAVMSTLIAGAVNSGLLETLGTLTGGVAPAAQDTTGAAPTGPNPPVQAGDLDRQLEELRAQLNMQQMIAQYEAQQLREQALQYGPAISTISPTLGAILFSPVGGAPAQGVEITPPVPPRDPFPFDPNLRPSMGFNPYG